LESLADAQGDIFYASADNTWAKLPAGAEGQVLRQGASIPEWASAVATQQFFTPCFTGAGGSLSIGDMAEYRLNSATDTALITLRVPNDFSSLTSAKVIIKPDTTGTFDWTAATTFGANGEAYNNHTDSTTADGQAATDAQLLELDVSAAFTGIAANDIINLTFTLDALDTTVSIGIAGLDFKYN